MERANAARQRLEPASPPDKVIEGGPSPDLFAAAEREDERQIAMDMETGTILDGAMFYRMVFKNKATGKDIIGPPELSARGVRALELVLSQRHRLSITEHNIEMVKYDEKDRSTWRYEALVKMRNETTGHDSIGACSKRFEPDPKLFNRRSCVETARLKAMKGQIPLKEFQKYWAQLTKNGTDEDCVNQYRGSGDDVEVKEGNGPWKKMRPYDGAGRPQDLPTGKATADDLNELRKVGGQGEVDRMREMSSAAVQARIAALKSEGGK